MKSYLLSLSLVLALASCSTAYKTGQTPDDVYYSPTRPAEEYVRRDKDDDEDRYYRGQEDRDDRYIRMKVRNRRWSTLDDGMSYTYHPAYYAPIWTNSPWNSYSYWNYLYNPYCCCNTVVVNPTRTLAYSKPRRVNLNVFNTPVNTKGNVKGNYGSRQNNSYRPSERDNYRNSGQSAGSFLRTILGSGSNNSNSSGSRTSESPSSSGSNSGSSGGNIKSSGGAAPVRKF